MGGKLISLSCKELVGPLELCLERPSPLVTRCAQHPIFQKTCAGSHLELSNKNRKGALFRYSSSRKRSLP